MQHPENLKPHDWIAILTTESVETPWGHSQPIYPVTGQPFEVLSVDFPFLLVRNMEGPNTHSLDLRNCTVKQLSKHYIRAYCDTKANDLKFNWKGLKTIRLSHKRKKSQEAPHPATCPRCGGNRIQQKRGNGPWKLVCKNCKLEQDPPENSIIT